MVDTAFIDELASSAPTPGGGGAAAYCGALSAALASMVGNLTVGKKSFAHVEGEVQEVLGRLEASRARLLRLVDEDAAAFKPLAAAYGMPKETAEQQQAKNEALQQALIQACEVPLQIMREVAALVDDIDFLAHNGSKMARSDAGVAATFARAAIEGASLNVYINVACMDDAGKAAVYAEEADAMLEEACNRCTHLFDFVKEQVS